MKQRGMAMFVSLTMLLLISLIVLHAARSSTLELLMGNNAQQTAQALMRAEDSVVAGESLVEVNYPNGPTIGFITAQAQGRGLYMADQINLNSVDWTGYGAERVGAGDAYREYIIEYLGATAATGGSLSVGAGAASNKRFFYRVSGRGVASRGGARVVQTIFATAE
ncbi:MAG: hypothetical protein IH927_04715 [Proteobacteria bacterium]|nr:hypothetical protein [Pseudomonadota bacterium]